MSEETTETDVVVDDEIKETGKGLRAQLEKSIAAGKQKDADNAGLRTQLLDRSYKELGLDPTKLIGKAIAEKYDGEPTTEGLAEFAKTEYGYEYTPDPEQHPQAQAIALGHAALDQVGQVAGSVAPTSQEDALAKAEAEGDWGTSMAIKGAQVAEMFRGPRR